jgi:hypothetical protein
MKRDWNIIRDVLIEVEALSASERNQFTYGVGSEYSGESQLRSEQALLLWKAGFVEAIDASTYAGAAVIAPELTWAGHDLLDTLRSKPVWEKVKSIAKDKGIELTFDAVKMLGKYAMESLLKG